MSDITSQDIVSAIISGDLDDDFDTIKQAIKMRGEHLAQARRLSLKPGDTVVFTNLRPKYLIGLEAEVVKINPKKVVLKCPDKPEYGRFAGSSNVSCQPDMIEKVEMPAPVIQPIDGVQQAAAAQGLDPASMILGQ